MGSRIFSLTDAARRSLRLSTAVAVVAVLAACSHKHSGQVAHSPSNAEAGEASTSGSRGLVAGGALGQQAEAAADQDTPKFAEPRSTGQGAPALASVPDKAPTPPSSKHERDKTIEGLLADREHARYTDQVGRIEPVAVRPLTEAALTEQTETAPPTPEAAPSKGVTTLSPPKPARRASGENASEIADQSAAPPPPPADVAMAPATEVPTSPALADATATANTAKPPGPPPAIPPAPTAAAGPVPTQAPVARIDGFRVLGPYDTKITTTNDVAVIDFSANPAFGGGPTTTLDVTARGKVADAARLGAQAKGSFRVIGRTSTQNIGAQERAIAVARELQRLGVDQDRIAIGTADGPEGRVDILLER